jgi:kynurenine formamidase
MVAIPDMSGQHPNVGEVELPEELREASREVSNWGRWGDSDELGTLNYITPELVVRAAGLVREGMTYSLSVPFDAYGPHGAHGYRRNPIHLMMFDGGDHDLAERLGDAVGSTEDRMRELGRGPMRFNDDYIMMPLQAATQWDALSHVYYHGRLYNGFSSGTVTSLGATRNGIDKVARAGKVVGRGVLLDVARHAGLRNLEAGTTISPADLDATAQAQDVEIREGDIILIRTGWWIRFLETRSGEVYVTNAPGVGWRCAGWLHEKRIAAVASDTGAIESKAPDFPGVAFPFHMLAIRDMGMMLGEMWDLEKLAADCAADRRYEFLLVAQPLLISGAVGSPLNPLAIR